MAAGPNVCRLRLAADLRHLRGEANLTIDAAAEQASISKSALSRIETAKVGASIPVVQSLLQIYGVAGSRAEELILLAKDAKAARRQGWWQPYKELLDEKVAEYIRFEAEAVEICAYEAYAIPGILQIKPYAEAILNAASRPNKDVGRQVEVRVRRQSALDELRFWAIIEESALRRPLGGVGVMRSQLEHLGQISIRPNVTIQVLPVSVEASPGVDGPFAILKFADDDTSRLYPDVGYVECQAGHLWLGEPDDVRRLRMTFDQLRAAALSREKTRDLIQEIAGGFKC